MATFITTKIVDFSNLLRQVYELVRPYGRKKLVLVFLVSLFQALSQVVSVAAIFPFLALAADPGKFESSRMGKWLIWLLPTMNHQQLLIVSGIALIIALFIANGFNLYGEVYRARFIWGFAHWLRMRMLYRISARPYGWFLQQNSTILIKKTTQNIIEFVNGILSPIIDGLSRVMVTVLLLSAIVLVEPKIAFLVGFVLGITYLTIFFCLAKFRRNLSVSLKIHWRGIFQQVGQLITGIKPVKVHGVEQYFLNRIQEHSRMQSKLQSWLPIVGNSPRYLIEPVTAMVFIALALKSLVDGKSAAALVPGLGLVAMAGYRMLPAVQMLYSQLSALQSNRYVLEEVFDEFRETLPTAKISTKGSGNLCNIESPADLFSFETEIALEGVCFAYPGNKKYTLKNINLRIPKNSSIAFVGETGSGKSTLVDLILGLYHPTEGKILVDGRPLEVDTVRKWQKIIGYVPQDIFLSDDTICRNIAFGVPDEEIDQKRVRKVAAMAQIADFIENDLADQYQAEVGERGVRLSGGQRQRIALARALYHKPQVLILDEATSALDHETEGRFMDTIYKLVGQFTVIMVAHRVSTTQRADVCCRVANGRVGLIADGNNY